MRNLEFNLIVYDRWNAWAIGFTGGATRVLVDDLKYFYPVLNPFYVDTKRLLSAFDKMSSRDIEPLLAECGIDPESEIPIAQQEPKPLPDRQELDDVVFDALGLTTEERKDVYRAVCQLVWNRLSKAKSVKKRK